MVHLILQMISTVLLFGGSLLLLFWKKKDKKPSDRLIRRVGVCVALIGFYTLATASLTVFEVETYTFGLISLPTLGGMVLLMFSLLNYLEAKR